MKKLTIASAAIVVLLTISISGLAWDDVGHKVSGYIAWQRMSEKTRERVIKILRAAPEDSHLSAFYMNYGPQPLAHRQLDYFSMVPTWADVIRDNSFPVRNKKYHQGNWHFSDIYWRQTATGDVEYLTDKKPEGLGLEKLIEFDKVMRSADASDAEKAIAIAWFMHIGGDLHQPLHTSGRHTDKEPNGDRGANLFMLSPEGAKRDEQVNLHWYWDSIIGRNFAMLANECESDYIRRISEAAMQRYPHANHSARLMLGEYERWKQETFSFAPTDVFNEELKRNVMPGDRYLRNAFRVSEERIAMAGYRLGDTLEAIFGK